jgi:hypothetical protein
VQPVNLAANPATNAAANAAANPPANTTANVARNVAKNAANTASAQPNIAANPGQNAGAQPPPAQANHAEVSQRRCVRDEVEIAQRANYDHDHGAPTPSTLTILSKQQSCGTCMTKSFYHMPSTTKITVLLMTSTSYRWLMPRQPVRE